MVRYNASEQRGNARARVCVCVCVRERERDLEARKCPFIRETFPLGWPLCPDPGANTGSHAWRHDSAFRISSTGNNRRVHHLHLAPCRTSPGNCVHHLHNLLSQFTDFMAVKKIVPRISNFSLVKNYILHSDYKKRKKNISINLRCLLDHVKILESKYFLYYEIKMFKKNVNFTWMPPYQIWQ